MKRCPEQTFEDYSALYKVLAAFYESLRLIRELSHSAMSSRVNQYFLPISRWLGDDS